MTRHSKYSRPKKYSPSAAKAKKKIVAKAIRPVSRPKVKATAVPVMTFDPSKSVGMPLPPDPMALAHWCGVKTKTLWYYILNRPAFYKIHTIPKPKGGVRVLHEPHAPLKFVQRMLLDRVLSKFPAQEHVGAYEDSKGVKYTADRHAGHAVVIEMDIKDFFGSTTRKFVREFFKAQGWPMSSAHAAADVLTFPITPTKSVVPQGAPTSPQICNMVGDHRFDKTILKELALVDAGWKYTRYSDNLIISHPDKRERDEVRKVVDTVKGIVSRAGYRVHPKKLKVMYSTHPKKPQRLLGLTVNDMPNVPVEEYRRLRAQVHRAETKGLKEVTGIPKGVGTLAHIEGRLQYYLHINPTSQKLLRLKDRVKELRGVA